MNTGIKNLFLLSVAVLGIALLGSCKKETPDVGNFKLLYWNIQNGMWDGQTDDYQRFTDWVKKQKPDICVWCEAQPIYKTGTANKLDEIADWQKDSLLTEFWKRLSQRYGHKYLFLGGHRDNYPQVITSRYPIESVARITGNADTLVSHGAGWARLKVAGKTLNVVTLHTWPQKYGYNVPVEDRERSKAEFEGDKFRRAEMEYICRHTLLSEPDGADGYWMMMGDYNSRSRIDNDHYGYPLDDTRFLVHDYILSATPYIDMIHQFHPGEFVRTTGSGARIDFVYCTLPLAASAVSAEVLVDEYTDPVRSDISNFWYPSDHLPIAVDFKL